MKRPNALLLFALALIILFPAISFAIPANPGDTQLVQPDGSVFDVRIKGDEWNNHLETLDGFTISKDDDNTWHHVARFEGNNAILAPTRADQEPLAGLKRNIRKKPVSIPQDARGLLRTPGLFSPEGSAPQAAPFGNFNGPILFILAEFSNRAGTYSESSWGSFVSNNIADFFNEASYGKVNLSPANETSGVGNNGVIGWVNLGYPHPNTAGSTGIANQQITRNAIIAADPFIDYSSYDTNSDNIIDSDELAVVIVVAGFERAYSSSFSPSVWGHKWSVGFFAGGAPTVDGVVVGSFNSGNGGYAQFGEIHQSNSSNQHQATMGIMVHELGHLIFGLPDLYDTDGSSSGIGAFGLMGAGSWGRANSDAYSGETPVLPSAWTRLTLGWVDEIEGTGVESFTAAGDPAANSANTVRKSSTAVSTQYFLTENRQPVGYDLGLQRYLGTNFGGLAIWHIDDTKTSNSNDANRLVDLEEGDGTIMGSSRGSASDLWYLGNATIFDNTTNPNSKLYSGAASGVEITDMSASGTIMTANFGGASPGVMEVTDSTDFFTNGEAGGPFTPSSKVYNVSNTGASPIDYSVIGTESWIDISNTSGTLVPGANINITISINSSANSLAVGNHDDTIAFTNTTNGNGDTTRDVSLTVMPDLTDFSANLGGDGFDMALDESRNQLYVSVPSLGEIVVFSTLDYSEVDRIAVGTEPHGIDLSHDSSVLYIALRGTGNVGVLDLETLTVSTIAVDGSTGNTLTFDVSEAKPNRVFVSANPGSGGFAWIAMIKTDAGNAVSRVADNRIIRADPIFVKDPAQQVLYIGEQFSPNSLYKLDINLDTAPIILEDVHGSITGTNAMDISPDGTRIYLSSGQVLNTTAFAEIGNLGPGIPAAHPDEILAYMGRAPNFLDVYNSTSFLKTNEIATQCTTTAIQRLKVLPGETGWIILGNDKICAREVGNKNRDWMPIDFDGDEDSDLLLVHVTGLLVSGLLANSTLGAFDNLVVADPTQGWTVNSSGDFNGDNNSDILLYNTTTGEYRVIEIDGTSVLGDAVVGIIDPSNNLLPVKMDDFEGDGRAEILVHDQATGYTALLFFDASGVFTAFEHVMNVDVGNNWTLHDTGDFNGDRKLDLLLFNTVSGEVSIIIMNGSTPGPQNTSFTLAPASGMTIVDTGDFTGDGRTDILALHTNGALGVIEMNGPLFKDFYIPGGLLPGWEVINAGYYDDDETMDLLILNTVTGDLMTALQDGATITTFNTVLNLGVGSGWTYHGGKP